MSFCFLVVIALPFQLGVLFVFEGAIHAIVRVHDFIILAFEAICICSLFHYCFFLGTQLSHFCKFRIQKLTFFLIENMIDIFFYHELSILYLLQKQVFAWVL